MRPVRLIYELPMNRRPRCAPDICRCCIKPTIRPCMLRAKQRLQTSTGLYILRQYRRTATGRSSYEQQYNGSERT